MVDGITHIIQVALTPVFLLSAIAALLNVFSTRLGRVADRVDLLSERLDDADPSKSGMIARQLTYLRRRSLILDLAVVMAAIGGGLTCLATLIIFLGASGNHGAEMILFATFALAVVGAMAAILAFVYELLLAGRGLRIEVVSKQMKAEIQSERAK